MPTPSLRAGERRNEYECEDQPFCGPGERMSEETEPPTKRTCSACPAGTSRGAGQPKHRLTACDPCGAEQYQDQQNQTSCLACTVCQPGESAVVNCTATTNRVCADETIPEIDAPATAAAATTTLPAGFGAFEIGGGDTMRASEWQGDGSERQDLTRQMVRSSPSSPGFIQPHPPYAADTTMPGTHTVVYNVRDDVLNRAVPVTRTVVIEDTPPSLTLRTAAEAWCGAGTSPAGTAAGMGGGGGYDWGHHSDFDTWANFE